MTNFNLTKTKLTVGFKGLVNNVDENVLDMGYAKEAYNFAFENGALTGELGIDEGRGFYPAPYTERHLYPHMPADKEIKKLFLHRRKNEKGEHDDRLVAHLRDGTFAYTSIFKTDEWHMIDVRIVGDVSAVNYNLNGKDVLLLACDSDCLYYLGDFTITVCPDTPKFTSVAVHNERVFGSVNGAQNQVWFSDEFDPSEWSVSSDKAGFITFADDGGDVIKVVSFLNYLYVFREYGIFRLTAYGEQSEFILKKVFTDTGRIVKSSIELCGDKIVFFAEDGLFVFDGYDVKRIAGRLAKIKSTDFISGAYMDDCYYIVCKTDDGDKNNAIVRYRFKDDSLSVLYGYPVKSLTSVRVHNGAQILCVFNDASKGILGELSNSGCVLGLPTHKRYVSPQNALSSMSLKIIRSIAVRSKSDITITVRLDGRSYRYAVHGSPFMQNVRVEQSGITVGFEIDSDAKQAHVAPLIVSYDKMKL